jgi:GNAT superfamily N-acetyltransferase
MVDLTLIEEKPTPAEYAALRRLMGWGEIDDETARATVDAAVFSVCLRGGDRLLGLARVVGDGVLYFYISDMMLLPELRGGGHGASLMKSVIGYLAKTAKPGATITVVPMKGREAFYERFGFKLCPNELLGAGLYLPDPMRRAVGR